MCSSNSDKQDWVIIEFLHRLSHSDMYLCYGKAVQSDAWCARTSSLANLQKRSHMFRPHVLAHGCIVHQNTHLTMRLQGATTKDGALLPHYDQDTYSKEGSPDHSQTLWCKLCDLCSSLCDLSSSLSGSYAVTRQEVTSFAEPFPNSEPNPHLSLSL